MRAAPLLLVTFFLVEYVRRMGGFWCASRCLLPREHRCAVPLLSATPVDKRVSALVPINRSIDFQCAARHFHVLCEAIQRPMSRTGFSCPETRLRGMDVHNDGSRHFAVSRCCHRPWGPCQGAHVDKDQMTSESPGHSYVSAPLHSMYSRVQLGVQLFENISLMRSTVSTIRHELPADRVARVQVLHAHGVLTIAMYLHGPASPTQHPPSKSPWSLASGLNFLFNILNGFTLPFSASLILLAVAQQVQEACRMPPC
jgi:hypothetical protein